jgi:hypothetical protein
LPGGQSRRRGTGNVHSAEGWEELLLPEIERQQQTEPRKEREECGRNGPKEGSSGVGGGSTDAGTGLFRGPSSSEPGVHVRFVG